MGYNSRPKKKISSISKGKRGELEFSKVINKHFPGSARRSQQYSGADGDADLICDALPFVHFEVKRTETFRYSHAIAQAKAGSAVQAAKILSLTGVKSTITPLVVHRYSKGKWMAIIEAEELLRILKENKEMKEQVEKMEDAQEFYIDGLREGITTVRNEDGTFFSFTNKKYAGGLF